MTGQELYANATRVRDKYCGSFKDHCNDVFTQMLEITFRNEKNKDELPGVFHIFDVCFSRTGMEALMEDLGLSVKVDYFFTDGFPPKGNSFIIKQLEK